MNLSALRPAPPAPRVRPADKSARATTPPPAPSPTTDSILAAVRPGSRAAAEKPGVETVREAIRGGSTRRTVVRTGVWSVPVVAAAVAAPAFAASPGNLPICGVCGGSARPPACVLTVVVGNPPTATCRCGQNLVCAAVGPLDLASVCVSQDLVLTSCGATTCAGVCLASGGTAVTAINTLATTVTGLVNGLVGCTANNSNTLPTNVCATPVAQGGQGTFGALCLVNSGGGALGTVLTTAVATLTSTLNGLGLGPASSCATGLSCTGGVNVTATGAVCAAAGFNLRVGFCRCP